MDQQASDALRILKGHKYISRKKVHGKWVYDYGPLPAKHKVMSAASSMYKDDFPNAGDPAQSFTFDADDFKKMAVGTKLQMTQRGKKFGARKKASGQWDVYAGGNENKYVHTTGGVMLAHSYRNFTKSEGPMNERNPLDILKGEAPPSPTTHRIGCVTFHRNDLVKATPTRGLPDMGDGRPQMEMVDVKPDQPQRKVGMRPRLALTAIVSDR